MKYFIDLRVVAAAACLCITNQASASENRLGMGMTYGAGLTSCGVWTEQRKTDEVNANLLLQWVLGYISALNDINPNALAKTDNAAIKGFLDKYCANYPLESLRVATAGLMKELMNPHPSP